MKPSDIDSEEVALWNAIGDVLKLETVMVDGSFNLVSRIARSELLRTLAIRNDNSLQATDNVRQIFLRRGGPVEIIDGVSNWSIDDATGIGSSKKPFFSNNEATMNAVDRLTLAAAANVGTGTRRTNLRITQADGTVKVVEPIVGSRLCFRTEPR